MAPLALWKRHMLPAAYAILNAALEFHPTLHTAPLEDGDAAPSPTCLRPNGGSLHFPISLQHSGQVSYDYAQFADERSL